MDRLVVDYKDAIVSKYLFAKEMQSVLDELVLFTYTQELRWKKLFVGQWSLVIPLLYICHFLFTRHILGFLFVRPPCFIGHPVAKNSKVKYF